MKKVFLGALALAAIALSSCENKECAKVALNSEIDTVSYLIGVDMANSLKNFPGEKLNEKAIMMAFNEKLNEKEPSCMMTDEEMNEFITAYFRKVKEAEAVNMKAKSDSFMMSMKAQEGVQSTESGLLYRVIKEGTGAKPAATDKVKVHYEGKLMDGTVFDSSKQRGEAAEFPLNAVIPGWTEGLQLMSEGSIYELIIPYELGYGERGAGNMIPPCSPLVFEVELLSIEK